LTSVSLWQLKVL